MSWPLIALKGLCREFLAGDEAVSALRNIDLEIEAGEMVAIVGPSGSGKTTLMHILGCLDRPSSGSYRLAGREVRSLPPDELARLRREHVGFIFQRYHLLPGISAFDNVEIPAIYAGTEREERREKVKAMLRRLGLGDRMAHRPAQLSGGQQQRVGIARALINGGDIILADEPTGALDSQRGQEVMQLLQALNAEGKTVIIVTHDRQVAQQARRIIDIRDGRIVDDRRHAEADAPPAVAYLAPHGRPREASQSRRMIRDRLLEASRTALLAMKTHKLRTALTMLGIIIGIASVVCVVALGEGSRQRVMQEISELGTSTLEIIPGKESGDISWRGAALSPEDAEAISRQPYVDSVSPVVNSSASLRYRNINANVQIFGVGEQYFHVRGMQAAQGRLLLPQDIRQSGQAAVIDQATRDRLFGPDADPLGAVVFLGKVPVRIVGVVGRNKGLFFSPDNLNIWLPYTSVLARMEGKRSLDAIAVRVGDKVGSDLAQARVTEFLQRRHGGRDFHVSNNDRLRKMAEKANGTLTLLITSIALISLLVGGIGVMNIMLVSVNERTREIGVRMAVGARQADIMQQFMIEAVLVCLIGGVLGIVLSFCVGSFFTSAGGEYTMIFSASSILSAFATCTLVGIVFGFVPARNAARLHPVEALARES